MNLLIYLLWRLPINVHWKNRLFSTDHRHHQMEIAIDGWLSSVRRFDQSKLHIYAVGDHLCSTKLKKIFTLLIAIKSKTVSFNFRTAVLDAHYPGSHLSHQSLVRYRDKARNNALMVMKWHRQRKVITITIIILHTCINIEENCMISIDNNLF